MKNRYTNNISLLKIYFSLTKPGIIYGNSLTAAAGFLFASGNQINYSLFLITLLGLALIMASGCVFNNVIDRDIDRLMSRTKQRTLVQMHISLRSALIYASSLGILGTLLLLFWTNLLTTFISLFGFFMYVIVYAYYKRRSLYGTLIGSFAGAVPPVVGYTAVSNQFDQAAFLLLLILILWQMPHFYAIALYRFEDYKAASLPVLPIVKGIQETKVHILFFIVAFMAAVSSLTILGYTGYVYLTGMLFVSVIWFGFALQGFSISNTTLWAKKVFRFSLIVIITFCFMLVG